VRGVDLLPSHAKACVDHATAASVLPNADNKMLNFSFNKKKAQVQEKMLKINNKPSVFSYFHIIAKKVFCNIFRTVH
jgi:hypothetical protein